MSVLSSRFDFSVLNGRLVLRTKSKPLLTAIIVCSLLPCLSCASSIFPSKTSPIRDEIARVEAELASLPVFPVNISPWTLGYSSDQQREPELPVRIEIQFAAPAVIDLVALMPSSFTDQRNQFQPWGFPKHFVIERLLPDGDREIIADYRRQDYPAPGIDPQFFPCANPVLTAGICITVSELTINSTWWQAEKILSLSEIFAFEGDRNVALNANVSATSSNEFGFAWSTKCLTDGFTFFSPIFHNLESPKNNINGYGLQELTLELDLEEVHQVDEFHLWPVVHSVQHNYPPSTALGFPQTIKLEASREPDFADATIIYEIPHILYRPGSGPFMHRVPRVEARYLRFVLSNGFPDFMQKPPERLPRITLSEIEILSEGEIISRGIPVHAPSVAGEDTNKIDRLTDGRSNEGRILPLRDWLEQFKRRVQLEAQLGALRVELDEAQIQEERRFRVVLYVAIGLILVLLQLILLVRVISRRKASQMRERIACDLHDEIGANVSSIAHTSELLAESISQPTDTQKRLLGNLIESGRQTYRETKHFIRFIEGESHSHDIAEQFVQVANLILGNIPPTFVLENTTSFNSLDPATKWNLLLFYKEALNNIIKHADATTVEIKTSRQNGELMLQVIDNGRGFSQDTQPCRHLQERSALLRGRLDIDSRLGEGTQVTLYFIRNRML